MDDLININEEYNKLKSKDNNDSNHHMRKINSERKFTSGILKRQRVRKESNFCKREKGDNNNNNNNNNSIKWDNKTINEQKDYRKKHPLDKEKLKSSISKYTSIEDNDDIYIKGLKKVNEIKGNDEIINKIFNTLNENISKKKHLKRNKSCLMIGKFKRKLNLKYFYMITEKEKIFDESLGEEQKLTLQNTLFNKISKNIKQKDSNNSINE